MRLAEKGQYGFSTNEPVILRALVHADFQSVALARRSNNDPRPHLLLRHRRRLFARPDASQGFLCCARHSHR